MSTPDSPPTSPVTQPPAAEPYGIASWRALGTYVQVVVAGSEHLEPARAVAAQLLDHVDATCSRFRDDTDLMAANRTPGVWVAVDPMLVRAVRAALWAAEQTSGLVDPTLGRSLEAVGYDRDFDVIRLGDGPAAIPVPAVPDAWRWVATYLPGEPLPAEADGLDADRAGVRVPPGVALDLGATGKAFASDLIATTVAEQLGANCIVSLGGDIAVGVVPGVEDPEPWPVTIAETHDEPPAAITHLARGGLATSTVMARRWHRGGAVQHHLLDPRTGAPVVPHWRTATVVATDCLAANTATTACIVLGEPALDWLTAQGLPARLVAADGTVTTVGGWVDEAP